VEREVSQASSATTPLQIEREFLLHILETLSQSRSINEYLEQLVEHIQDYAQCGCVGIRLLDENGGIPYAAYTGFSRKFYESENPLSVKCDQCMCINVIEQKTNPKHPFYTDGGSFHSNGTTRLLASERVDAVGPTRNVCNAYGYETVALVPMKHRSTVLGLIHLADERESQVSKEKVHLLEQVAKYIGEALHTFIAERERERLLTQVGYERRRVENLAGDLKKERDILKVIMENTRAHLAYLDRDFTFIAVNPTYANGSGHTSSELIGQNHFDLFPDKDNQAIFERVRDSGRPVEFHDKPFEFKDQPWRDVTFWDWTLNPIKDAAGKVTGLVLSLVDTTRRKKVEHDLGERFKELACLYGVSQLVAKSDMSLDEVLKGTVDHIPPGWQYPEITCARITFDGKEYKTANFRATEWNQSSDINVKGKKHGSIEVYYLEEKPKIDEGPFIKEERALIEGLTRTLSEMAERKRAEEELRQERDKAQKYLDMAGVMLVLIGTNQKVNLINIRGCQILGYKREEDILGRNWFDNFLPRRARREAKEAFNKLVAGEVELVEHHERPVLTRDGRERTIAWHNTVLRDESGKITALLSSGEDITERQQADDNLRRALEVARQRQIEVSALLEGSRAVLENRDFTEAAKYIFTVCKSLVGATAGYISLLSKDGAENEVVFLDPGVLNCKVDPSLPMPIRGMRAEAYKDGRAIYNNKFATSKWVKYMPPGHVPLESALFAPLNIEGKTLGLLGLGNKPGGFTENDARIASAFGELAAVALYNSRLLESLERSEERFRSVVETAQDAIVNVDENGHIASWNYGAETIFGHTAEEAIGQLATLIIPGKAHQDHIDVFDSASQGHAELPPASTEGTGIKKDGTEFPIELSLSNWHTKEGYFFTAIMRDITERKKLDQLKDELTSLVSHELRTPLTVIIGAVNTVLTEEDLLSAQEKHQLLNDAAAEAESLSHLLGNLLELSRVRAEQLVLHAEPVNTRTIVQNAIDKISKQTASNRFSLDFPKGLPPAYADPLRLERILYNLLDNAVKYSSPDSQIRIAAKPRGEQLVIGVKDQGQGISVKEQSRLFAPFQRLESNAATGIGLGLLVCRRLVEAHGGRIWVESRPGRGSTFFFTIPLQA
jgi:PAS domain S-box-containing protein